MISAYEGSEMSISSVRKNWLYYLMLLPALLLSCAVILLPAIQTVVTSFTDWNGMSNEKTFVGLANYAELFGDRIFRIALTNNLKWMVVYLTIPLLIAMFVSFVLYRKEQRTFFLCSYMIPYIIAPIANAIIWQNMVFSPLSGVIGYLNNTFGWSLSSPLSDTSTALFGVAGVSIWRYWGFLAIVLTAALRQISSEQIEAAKVEGASAWQMFRMVAFPNIRPTFMLLVAMLVIQSFIVYDYVYLLTKGGPANATEVLGTLSYSYAFSRFRYGMASAVSLIMTVLGLGASILYVRSNRKEEQV